MSSSTLRVDGVEVVRLESDELRIDVAPAVGGRVISVWNKRLGHEFLWRNKALKLERLPPGSEYDPNFFGGIDELAPNDIPEQLGGVDMPDHGELWTLPLDWRLDGERLALSGKLPKAQLNYRREISLRPGGPWIDLDYHIENPSAETKSFLWKLHAALAIAAGDVIDCPARQARVVDLAWSRFGSLAPFAWPTIEGQAANVVPPLGKSVDFFYLYDLSKGQVGWTRPSANLKFAYEFDTKKFPFVWLFASYGGFDGHYTAILEPCTTMPISVNEALASGSCSTLEPGGALSTCVSIYAGPLA